MFFYSILDVDGNHIITCLPAQLCSPCKDDCRRLKQLPKSPIIPKFAQGKKVIVNPTANKHILSFIVSRQHAFSISYQLKWDVRCCWLLCFRFPLKNYYLTPLEINHTTDIAFSPLNFNSYLFRQLPATSSN